MELSTFMFVFFISFAIGYHTKFFIDLGKKMFRNAKQAQRKTNEY